MTIATIYLLVLFYFTYLLIKLKKMRSLTENMQKVEFKTKVLMIMASVHTNLIQQIILAIKVDSLLQNYNKK
jgi:heme/copper-type cytochrome/quinol oxidase subunit 2